MYTDIQITYNGYCVTVLYRAHLSDHVRKWIVVVLHVCKGTLCIYSDDVYTKWHIRQTIVRIWIVVVLHVCKATYCDEV